MCTVCTTVEQEDLFPNFDATVSESEMFQWEIEVNGDTLTVQGTTRREAYIEVGRALGSTGLSETCYRHALQRKPRVLSQTPIKFLEQK